MLVAADPVFRELHVSPRRSADNEGEARGVRAVLFRHHQGGDDVPQRFAHLGALFVAYEAVEVDIVEGDVAEKKSRHQYHARDPEKEDVVSGFEHIGGMVCLKVRRCLRPAERRERPEAGRKPRVERVGVLFILRVAEFARWFLAGNNEHYALFHVGFAARLRNAFGLVVPDRNPVPVPYLPGDAPRAQVVYPVVINLLKTFGKYFYLD